MQLQLGMITLSSVVQTLVLEQAVIGIGPTNRHHNDGWYA